MLEHVNNSCFTRQWQYATSCGSPLPLTDATAELLIYASDIFYYTVTKRYTNADYLLIDEPNGTITIALDKLTLSPGNYTFLLLVTYDNQVIVFEKTNLIVLAGKL